jgi:excisionase family DNA binding protein
MATVPDPHSVGATETLQADRADDARGYYSVVEAAALLGVSRVSIWRWIGAGRLPAVRLGSRTTRIKREDLERVLTTIRPAGVATTAATGLPVSWAGDRAALDAPYDHLAEPDVAGHVVQFYESDAFLLESVQAFIGGALHTDGAGIVVATTAHLAGLDRRLRAIGVDVDGACSAGRYVPLDAAATLASITIEGTVHPGRFAEVVGEALARARAGGRPVRIFGEMVGLLVVDGQPDAAVRLEGLWNDLQQTEPFSLLCGYPMEALCGNDLADVVGEVCRAHTRVIPAESYAALTDVVDQGRAIATLQQKARSLEAEIAGRREAEARLREALAAERVAREMAEEALRLRDEFLSIAAHELRTPLAGLLGHAQLALRRVERDGRLEPERLVPTVTAIIGQAQKLSRLLGQFLDVSRLQTSKLILEPLPTDLVDLVRQVVAGVQMRSDQHPLTLIVPPSLEALVDPLRLEQVLTNLLDNAVKYSPDGGPIEVVLSRLGGGAAELSVRDRGVGIPPEKRGQIFERFFQAHGDGYLSGLGLGLYVSRQIVERHNGQLRAEFPPDGGTRFVATLPLGLSQ